MSQNGVVVVTGSSGGIGSAICQRLFDEGYRVIGLDRSAPSDGSPQIHIATDLVCYSQQPAYRAEINNKINEALNSLPLKGLVNNAAVQRLGHLTEISQNDWDDTLAVNVSAPLWLSQSLFDLLKAGSGTIVNVASIHAKLTKPGFVAYATSKSALLGLNASLALDIGASVTVNAISPAAIDTDMLRAGFIENQHAFNKLKSFHPTGDIGSPSEVAMLVSTLIAGKFAFLNGTQIELNGGIGVKLSDPSDG